MNAFEINIRALYGIEGEQWLQSLPQRVKNIAFQHNLRHLKPLPDLSYNYVLSGFQEETPIIVKLSFDPKPLAREAAALKAFLDHGAIRILVQEKDFLVLERALPGTSLKSFFPQREEEAISITAEIIQRLHQAPKPKKGIFPTIDIWLKALDQEWNLPQPLLSKARSFRDRLLASSPAPLLLHGDLHHDNILKTLNGWIAIDPKGVLGDPSYEVAAFIRNPIPDLLDTPKAFEIIQRRIKLFSHLLFIPEERILKWCFVQAILAWIWALEDSLNPSYFSDLTILLNKMIKA